MSEMLLQSQAGEINLENAAGGVVAEIETLGPATTADMTATLGSGIYTFQCHLSGQAVTSSAPVQVTGQGQTTAVTPVTVRELTGPNQAYQPTPPASWPRWPARRSGFRPTCAAAISPRREPTGWPPSWPGNESARPTTASAPRASR